MLDTLNSLLALVILLLAAWGLGRPLAQGLGVADGRDALAMLVWRLALGLVAWGLVLTGLGLAGALYCPLIGALTLVAAGYALYHLLGGLRPAAAPTSGRAAHVRHDDVASPTEAAPTWGGMLSVLVAAAVACAAALLAALAPPTAGDALCYHLELPKTYLAEHALVALPDSENATYPQLAEMWFLWALALEGGVTAQLVHWGLGVLLALATVVLATPILGRPWSCAAGAVVLLLPGITNQMTAPLNDVALAAFSTMALAAWRRAATEPGDVRWWIVAGLMLGAALAIKYVALLWAAAVGCVWLAELVRRRAVWRPALRGAAATAIVGVSVAGVWYVRAAGQRGDPVYPFLSPPVATPAPEAPLPDKTPLGWHPLEVLSAPLRVTLEPGRFGGSGHQLGPLLLMTLPGLLVARRLRGLGELLAVGGVYCLLWYALRQNVRFLYPVLPLAAVACVWVLVELRRWTVAPRGVALAAVAGALLLGVAAPVKRARHKLAVATGWERRADYLARHEPTFRAAEAANAQYQPHDRLLSQDYRGFYFRAPATREIVFRRRTGYDRHLASPIDLARRLQEAGFTHVLLTENLAAQGAQFDPTLARLVEAALAAEEELPPPRRSWATLADYQATDADGGQRRYRLLRLPKKGTGRMPPS